MFKRSLAADISGYVVEEIFKGRYAADINGYVVVQIFKKG